MPRGIYKRTKEHNENISKALKGKKPTFEQFKNLKRMHRKNKGRKREKWEREKISKGQIGRKVSEETKNKIRKSLKGDKFSKKRKENISKALKGRTIPQEVRDKISKYLKKYPPKSVFRKGHRPANYKGTTPLREQIRKSPQHKEWVMNIMKRDWFTCQHCGDTKPNKFHVHHIKPFAELYGNFLRKYDYFSPMEDLETLYKLSLHYEPFYKLSNGITLCAKCHSQMHKKERSKK